LAVELEGSIPLLPKPDPLPHVGHEHEPAQWSSRHDNFFPYIIPPSGIFVLSGVPRHGKESMKI